MVDSSWTGNSLPPQTPDFGGAPIRIGESVWRKISSVRNFPLQPVYLTHLGPRWSPGRSSAEYPYLGTPTVVSRRDVGVIQLNFKFSV
jgi:hypothetical protein